MGSAKGSWINKNNKYSNNDYLEVGIYLRYYTPHPLSKLIRIWEKVVFVKTMKSYCFFENKIEM